MLQAQGDLCKGISAASGKALGVLGDAWKKHKSRLRHVFEPFLTIEYNVMGIVL
jgi:hypothetical protein